MIVAAAAVAVVVGVAVATAGAAVEVAIVLGQPAGVSSSPTETFSLLVARSWQSS